MNIVVSLAARDRNCVVGGSVLLAGSLQTSMTEYFPVLSVVWVDIVTLLHQFGCLSGRTVEIGICGGLITYGLLDRLEKTAEIL